MDGSSWSAQAGGAPGLLALVLAAAVLALVTVAIPVSPTAAELPEDCDVTIPDSCEPGPGPFPDPDPEFEAPRWLHLVRASPLHRHAGQLPLEPATATYNAEHVHQDAWPADYASGEGNPDVNRAEDQSAQWVDPRCHRSARSGPAQTAAALEQADPHTSVTFVSFACSEATIDRVYRAYRDACPGTSRQATPANLTRSIPTSPATPAGPSARASSAPTRVPSRRAARTSTTSSAPDPAVPAATVGDRLTACVKGREGSEELLH